MAAEALVIADIETAGLKDDAQIIQLSAMAVDAATLREREAFERKLRFDEARADPEALRVNSFEPTVWKRLAARPEDVAFDFSNFLRRHATIQMKSARTGRPYHVAQLVCHNATFDGPRIQRFYEERGLFLPAGRRVYCTLQRAYWLFAEDQTLTPPLNYKLGTLCEYFGVRLPADEAHDAMADVRGTVELLRAMRGHLAQRELQAA